MIGTREAGLASRIGITGAARGPPASLQGSSVASPAGIDLDHEYPCPDAADDVCEETLQLGEFRRSMVAATGDLSPTRT
jgi:hypothetical protein